MTLTKKEQLKLINEAFQRINYVLSIVSWGQYGDIYYKMNLEEEKAHRRLKPEDVVCGLTQTQAVKLFYVKQIADFLLGADKPLVEHYLSYRKSVYYAYALVHDYEDKLRDELKDIDLEALTQLDYAELNKSEES